MLRYPIHKVTLAAALSFSAVFTPFVLPLESARAAGTGTAPKLVISGQVERDEEPLLLQGEQVYAPARMVLERLGYQVSWDAEERAITAERAGTKLLHRLGSDVVVVNQTSVRMDAAASTMQGGRLWIPVQPFVQAMGDLITYSSLSQTLYIKPGLASVLAESFTAGEGRLHYEGERLGDQRHGQGRLTRDGELLYEGGFTRDQPDGFGRLYHSGALLYEGNFSNGMPELQGTYYYPNGNIYKGTFLKGQMTGSGILSGPNGVPLYSGEWVNGIMEGVGRLFYPNGKEAYSGSMKQNTRTGYGVAYLDGDKKSYEGAWLRGKRHGEGIAFSREGKLEFSGTWVHDRREGPGRTYVSKNMPWTTTDEDRKVVKTENRDTVEMTDVVYQADRLVSEGTKYAYLGDKDVDGMPHGKGELLRFRQLTATQAGVLQSHDYFYNGEIRQGRLTGTGKLYDAEGYVVYDGELVDGQRQGRGKGFEKGLLVYEGSWSRDRKEGSGRRFEYPASFTGYTFTGSTSVMIYESSYQQGQALEDTAIFKYYGEYERGLPHGAAVVTLLYDASHANRPALPLSPDAAGSLVYEGLYADGVRKGDGKLYEEGKLVYQGEFADGLPHGNGISYRDGQRYEGSFEKGLRHGSGKVYNEARQMIFEGRFAGGLRSGFGKQYSDDGKLQYEGEFKNDLRHGFGKLYWSNGTHITYQGEFREGRTLQEYLRELNP